MINDRSKIFLPVQMSGRKSFFHLQLEQTITLYMQISIMIFPLISGTFLVIVLVRNVLVPILNVSTSNHIWANN